MKMKGVILSKYENALTRKLSIKTNNSLKTLEGQNISSSNIILIIMLFKAISMTSVQIS